MAHALTGRQMLRRASEHMKHESRKKSRKHHALKFNQGANPMTGADLGGFNNAGSFRGGQSIGQGGGPQIGDWPNNGRQDARKGKHAHKAHKHLHRSHKARKHHSVMGLSESRKHESHRSHKVHKNARRHAKAYRGGTPTQGEFGKGLHLSKRSHDARKHLRGHAHQLPHLKPKGKVGRAQTGRLNRNFKTGGFNKIANSAGREYGSSAAGRRVAGAIFHKMAVARGNAAHKGRHAHKAHKRSHKSYAHHGHTHRSHKAMKEC